MKAGNQQLYSVLVDRYGQFVFNLVLRIIQQREVAEELSQDVFVKAYRFLGTYKGAGKFSTWLYRIAHNTCYSYLRNKKSPAVFPGDDRVVSYSDRQSESHNPVSDPLEQRSREVVIQKALAKLPLSDQEIISLYYQGEQSVAEIAVITDLSEGNVKIRLFRSRQKLKDELTELYKEIQS